MSTLRSSLLFSALVAVGLPAWAQDHDHHAAPPVDAAEEVDTDAPAEDPHAGHHPPAAPAVDHAAMGHDVEPEPAVDHSTMDHSKMDHAGMGHGEATTPVTPIPAVTAADRAAAEKPAQGHPAHDNLPHHYLLFDRLEASREDDATAIEWDVHGWYGTDLHRAWLRTEGERTGGDTEHAQVELLYGRSVTPWWDVVAGVRHDFGHGPSQSFAAFGVQGLAPYKYEFAATAYVGTGGQTALSLEAEYDTLLTNRLILQWVAEAAAYGKSDERRDQGAGLDSVEFGARLRYEFRREFAPYVGVVWERRFGDAAYWRRAAGEDADDVRFVAGVRFWF